MDSKIAVVIPCFRVSEQVLEVVRGALQHADTVICVDDACPDGSGRLVEQHFSDDRVKVLFNPENLGVGGAMKAGYRLALETGHEYVVKLDGDGQMDPAQIPVMVGPLRERRADYCKGNRFSELSYLRSMPGIRLFGNAMLSLFSKISSGYWRTLDPTNGFTAIHADVLNLLPLDRISDRFFFESDILFRLSVVRAVVVDVPMEARYGSESTNLKIHRVFFPFLAGHLRNLLKRIVYTYFVRDFNIATLELLGGTALALFALIFGGSAWQQSNVSGVTASAGTVMVAGLSALVAIQLLLAFLNYDIQNVPDQPISAFRRRAGEP